MITLYSKDFATKYGSINSLCEAFVEEERNGLFEISFVVLNIDSLFNYVKEENIVVVNANDTLLNQKFRIYMTRKLMNNKVEVYARHISFDLMYDYIDNVSFTNQSCEYALNQLFRNSNFSKHYKGYSDIVNAQNYSMSMANVLEAIGGKQGSIIDTFGTGAELLRDNENIHVLNRRGNDNEVTIEYRKNLTGFELEEDTTDLVTRILPYAKYNDSETNEEIVVKADYVDSPLIGNYSHPYIASIDYSNKFEDGEIPTVSKLQELARKEYRDNKVDIPKQNFKIEFIPLSKCVGYEELEDKINLCDTVTIIDTRYNVKTQAKVIRTVFNVLKNRYESMELGEPRTSLGDIIGNGGDNEPIVGPPGPQGPPGQDGSIGDFPNTLPSTPVLESFVYGFSNIELSWTFENKVYYSYELYGSKTKDFKPNTFDLIFEGQASTYMFQAKPNETWYFRVCAINTHGERTNFSNQVTVNTTKIEDLSNYVENMAISEALIGTLSLDRGWIGTLKGNYIDARQLSVTDGNGKRTLDIDSFGNVNIDSTSIRLAANGVLDIDTSNYYLNNTEMIFRRDGKKTYGIKRGYSHLYNPTDNTLMGSMIPRSTVGGQYYDNGISTVVSNNGYYYSISRASDWMHDEQVTFSPVEYLILNFRDRGTQKMGLNLYAPFYAHDGIDMSGESITNADTITSNNISTLSFRHPNGNEMFSTDGYTVSNKRGWYWNGNNLLDPVIIGGSYGYSITPSIDTYSNVKTFNDDVNLDEVLDKINIYPARTTYKASFGASLEIDVTELRESENADMFIKTHNTVNLETGEDEVVENIDMKSLLHLALLEIKKLKEEIQTIKGGC